MIAYAYGTNYGPLFWMHIQPYGEVRLNMGSRLQLAIPAPQEPDPEPEPAAA